MEKNDLRNLTEGAREADSNSNEAFAFTNQQSNQHCPRLDATAPLDSTLSPHIESQPTGPPTARNHVENPKQVPTDICPQYPVGQPAQAQAAIRCTVGPNNSLVVSPPVNSQDGQIHDPVPVVLPARAQPGTCGKVGPDKPCAPTKNLSKGTQSAAETINQNKDDFDNLLDDMFNKRKVR